MPAPIRVRFAPSPTVISTLAVRARRLFNWLHAKHTGGRLVLRIEIRIVPAIPKRTQAIYDGLRWSGWIGMKARTPAEISGPISKVSARKSIAPTWRSCGRQIAFTMTKAPSVSGSSAPRLWSTILSAATLSSISPTRKRIPT